jgi:multiple sugar transport system substrate-binding protein
MDKKSVLSRRSFLRLAGGAAAGMALAACQPKTVIVEKVVEKEVTKVVKETIKETVIVEGTPQVVEKEVTKVVKEVVEKVVEATPLPEVEGQLVWYASQAADHLPPFKQQQSTFKSMYPKVEIEEVFVPWSEYSQKMTTMIAGGETIDVVWLMIDNGAGGPLNVNTWIKKDALLDLTPLFSEGTIKREDYFPGLLSKFEIGGKFWGTPFECWQAVFWYNVNLFEEAGLSIPDENWTWEDYREAAAALTKKGDDGRTTQFGTRCAGWNTFVYQAGGRILGEDGVTLMLDTDEALRGFEEWHFYNGGGYSPVGDDTKVFGGLQTGKVATHSDGNYMWTTFREVSRELEFDLGATLAPAGPGPEPWNKAHRAGYNIWSAFKSTKVPDLALKFVTHLGYGAGAEPWAATGRVSPLKRFDIDYYQQVAGLSEEEKARYATALNATFMQMDKGYLHANTVGPDVEGTSWGTIATPINEELNKVVVDKSQTLEEALQIAFERVRTGIAEAQ